MRRSIPSFSLALTLAAVPSLVAQSVFIQVGATNPGGWTTPIAGFNWTAAITRCQV